jgi:hypothetical protein
VSSQYAPAYAWSAFVEGDRRPGGKGACLLPLGEKVAERSEVG